MTHPQQHSRARSLSFGKGFDFVMASPDHRRFRDWWNRNGCFRVSQHEADSLLSQPEFHDAV